jgi:hypothetical protein
MKLDDLWFGYFVPVFFIEMFILLQYILIKAIMEGVI